MKKSYLILALILWQVNLYGQTSDPGVTSTGNAGGNHAFRGLFSNGIFSNWMNTGYSGTAYNLIGHSDPHSGYGVIIGNNIVSPVVWMFANPRNAFSVRTMNYQGDITTGTDLLTVRANGNVGIGTIDPKQILDISSNHSQLRLTDSDDGDYVSLSYSSDMLAIRNNVNDGSTPILSINDNGHVGIGTASPDSKLAVNGIIHTKEVKVDLNGWSDFVFYDNYELPTLQEVENHIKEKGHLKDIPSADDVKENGINLGEMNAKLLQKVEELTLYLIDQNKKIEELTGKVQRLENE